MLQTGAQVADKAVQGLLSRVDQLAEKLGTTAANVWAIYVAQARVEALRDTVIGAVFLLLSVLAFIVSKKIFSEKGSEDAMGGFFVAGTILLIISMFWFYPAISEWLNPQFWAFQNITADIKSLL